MNLTQAIEIYATGTPEGSKKAWDTRGRGRKEKEKAKKGGEKTPKKGSQPIYVKTIDEAIKAISEGKDVELNDAKEVHTLLNRLAVIVQEAKAAGEKAKNYDLCHVTVKGTNIFCVESLGISRLKMPQLSGKAVPGSAAAGFPKKGSDNRDGAARFITYLAKEEGITTHSETVPGSFLRASQNELSGAKVASMMVRKDLKLTDVPLFVSRDNYIVDGHHRWAAIVGRDSEDSHLGNLHMKVIKVDAPISKILRLANAWTKKVGIKQEGV